MYVKQVQAAKCYRAKVRITYKMQHVLGAGDINPLRKIMTSIEQADQTSSYKAIELAFRPIAMMFVFISAVSIGGAFGASIITGLSLGVSKLASLLLGAQFYATASQPGYIIAYAMIGCVIGAAVALMIFWHLRDQMWRQ